MQTTEWSARAACWHSLVVVSWMIGTTSSHASFGQRDRVAVLITHRLIVIAYVLRTIQPEEAVIRPEQLELMAYFQKKLDALPERRPMQDDDIFLSDVTVGEFFALAETEKDRLWEEVHIEAERQLGYREQEVRPDALPAR